MKEHYTISLKTDKNGMLSRQCQRTECRKYFKIKVEHYSECQNKEIYCPSCGFKEFGNKMFTEEQMEYAKSIIMQDVMGYINNEMKKFEVKPDRNALFSIGISYTPGKVEIRDYVEEELKKSVTCEKCNREFSIYSASAFCPFCGPRNPLIIFNQNSDLAIKFVNLQNMITGSDKSDLEEHGIFEKLIEKSLDTMVTAFETYCKSKYTAVITTSTAESEYEVLRRIRNSFQNLNETEKLLKNFKVNLRDILGTQFDFVYNCFEKRHVFIHNSGIIDQKFIERTNCDHTLLGKKLILHQNEIITLIELLKKLISEIENKL